MNTKHARAPIAVATGRHRFTLAAVAVAVALAAGPAGVWAANAEKKAEKKAAVEFEDVRLIIEFNASDEDVGVQFFLDVDSWQSVRIFNPAGKEIFDARAKSSLLNQGGGTEMFVESNEPTLDDTAARGVLRDLSGGNLPLRRPHPRWRALDWRDRVLA